MDWLRHLVDWHAIAADVRQHFWIYLSLPFVSAIIGYVTKVVAIRMMFQPMNFIGIKPPYLGWQGIIPRNAAKMAGISVDLMTSQLITVREVFERLEPERIAKELEPHLIEVMDHITRDVAERYQPGLWNSLPEFVRKRIVQRVQADLPDTIADIMRDVSDHIETLFDLKAMVVGNLVRDKTLLNRIFWETGKQEFKFFGTAGFYFGFGIGVVQMICWILWKQAWMLPAFGLFVGFASDWIALQMLFRPLRPRRVMGLKIQGLFLRRQQEVAHDYGNLIADQILTPEKIWIAVLEGPLSDRVLELMQRHVMQAVDEQAGAARPILSMMIGSQKYVEMKQAVADSLIRELPQALQSVNRYAERAMDIRNTLTTKMQQLSAEQFEGMLRPVFKEDEWILIAIGALLGFLVGELQVFLMVH
ncbi:DUF445 domain-containing protein [Solimonas marina]|uniref:DUF445 family protein n=1 Tax=Solimonas marina TaxID=2714601 RepID=A0A969W6A5_9GAMM|nr:DUF445 family protein [Solimonas marina]NKF21192.1 DUF445 family protein [Solimonas marina]